MIHYYMDIIPLANYVINFTLKLRIMKRRFMHVYSFLFFVFFFFFIKSYVNCSSFIRFHNVNKFSGEMYDCIGDIVI